MDNFTSSFAIRLSAILACLALTSCSGSARGTHQLNYGASAGYNYQSAVSGQCCTDRKINYQTYAPGYGHTVIRDVSRPLLPCWYGNPVRYNIVNFTSSDTRRLNRHHRHKLRRSFRNKKIQRRNGEIIINSNRLPERHSSSMLRKNIKPGKSGNRPAIGLRQP